MAYPQGLTGLSEMGGQYSAATDIWCERFPIPLVREEERGEAQTAARCCLKSLAEASRKS